MLASAPLLARAPATAATPPSPARNLIVLALPIISLLLSLVLRPT
jgi:hypothetical protein